MDEESEVNPVQTILLNSLFHGVHDGWLSIWTKPGNKTRWFDFSSEKLLDNVIPSVDSFINKISGFRVG